MLRFEVAHGEWAWTHLRLGDVRALAMIARSRTFRPRAQINNATNRSIRALTAISTLLIPPTLFTGAFGMNVPGIPFEHSPSGFVVATALCGAVVGGALLLLRRLGM